MADENPQTIVVQPSNVSSVTDLIGKVGFPAAFCLMMFFAIGYILVKLGEPYVINVTKNNDLLTQSQIALNSSLAEAANETVTIARKRIDTSQRLAETVERIAKALEDE